MACALKMETKSGRTVYRLEQSRGRNRSKLTRRWYPPIGWSEKAIQQELQRQLRQFETDCLEGKVLSREDRKLKEEEEKYCGGKLPKNQNEALDVLKEVIFQAVNLRIASESNYTVYDDGSTSVNFHYKQYDRLMNYLRSLSPELKEYADMLDDIGRGNDGLPFWLEVDDDE